MSKQYVIDTPLIQEWDWEKNILDPSHITRSSAKKVYWICSVCKYSWEQSVNNRTNGKGCPSCSGRVLKPGLNDLGTVMPEVYQWWAETDTNPHDYFPKSNKKITWRCPQQHHEFKQSIKLFKLKCLICVDKNPLHLRPELADEWSFNNLSAITEYSYNSAQRVQWTCALCKHEWEAPIYQRVNGTNCPQCAQHHGSSQEEDRLVEYLLELGFIENQDFYRNLRRPLNNRFELDIYFPQLNFAIEYNGLWWHNELHKNRTYHHDKWLACQEVGIQLVQIWEDDWLAKPQLVKNMLAHKLGQSKQSKIYARKARLESVDYETAVHFLDTYHIQGSVTSSFYTGLWSENTLVALAAWRNHHDTLYLDRYSTSQPVVGGLGKLLADVKKRTSATQIITFAAHDVSNGNLYEQLGFSVDRILPADYWYVYKGRRVHQSNFRRTRFQQDSELQYEATLSERELALVNRIHRIWDAGKTRYVMSL